MAVTFFRLTNTLSKTRKIIKGYLLTKLNSTQLLSGFSLCLESKTLRSVITIQCSYRLTKRVLTNQEHINILLRSIEGFYHKSPKILEVTCVLECAT